MEWENHMSRTQSRHAGSIEKETSHVAVLVDTATGWGRRLVRGVVNYSQHGSWYLWIKSGGQDASLWLPPGWCGDGIIARIGTRAAARRVRATGVPVVNISAIELPGVDFPRVATDLLAAGRMAAEHLLDRGFVHFAYYGLAHRDYVDRHYDGFARAVSAVCDDCPFYGTTFDAGVGARTAWSTRQRGLSRWLKTLAKPVAIVTWTTDLGRELVHACRRDGLLVPEQVAVLAADNDELLCEACSPSLSGMALTSERIGFEAARLLDRMMRGESPPKRSRPAWWRASRPIRLRWTIRTLPGRWPSFAPTRRIRFRCGTCSPRFPSRAAGWNAGLARCWAAGRRRKSAACVWTGRNICWPKPIFQSPR